MQFLNPQISSVTCTLIFHPAGTAGSATDPSRVITLAAGQLFSSDDMVAAMGQSGTGSFDVRVPADQNGPVILTRLYNDAGAAGTSGLTEPPIAISDGATTPNLLTRGVTGYLITPRDVSRTRFNVGVRTLFSGASITVRVLNASGVAINTVTKTYTANYFEQTDAATFTGVTITSDETIQVSVNSGGAIIYGSTTDNTTNDPAIQFVYGFSAVL
jgi:hypothetical protein